VKKVLLALFSMLLISGSVLAQKDSLSDKRIAQIAQSVVQIFALDAKGKPLSSGSGTIINDTGMIFTNRHVVAGGADFAIYMTDDMSEAPVLQYFASVSGVSTEIDFALLQIDRDRLGKKVDTSRLKLPFLENAATGVKHGENIWVFGFPGIGEGYMVLTQGTITTIENGTVDGERLPVWYQTDAEISPGNSGGLVVNSAGEFVGIPTQVQSEGRTLGRLGGVLPWAAIKAAQNSLVDPSEVSPDNNQQVSSGATGGVSVDCGGGLRFDNGVEITFVQMRAGFTYTARAIGIDGFDPVLAVIDPKTGKGVCRDNNVDAASLEVDLPSTGYVKGSSSSSQIDFSQKTGKGLADVSLVVGGKDNMPGQFVLILEGPAVTKGDGSGDPLQVKLTPGLVGSGVPLSVYMMTKTNKLNPLIYVGDEKGNPLTDKKGNPFFLCDDAGTNSCTGETKDMSNSAINTKDGRVLPGVAKDAMLYIPLKGFEELAQKGTRMTFYMTSYRRSSFGEYVIVFHMGTQ
jgi:hypothetical protein